MNPYASPTAKDASPPVPGRCPRCQSSDATMPTYTWWGGLVGQKILNHVVCNVCGTGFNRKTGRSNTKNIVIYNIVGAILFIVLVSSALAVIALFKKVFIPF